MGDIATLKVKHRKSGTVMIINAVDFNDKAHKKLGKVVDPSDSVAEVEEPTVDETEDESDEDSETPEVDNTADDFEEDAHDESVEEEVEEEETPKRRRRNRR